MEGMVQSVCVFVRQLNFIIQGGFEAIFFALTPVIGTLQIKAALEVLECSLIISRRSPVGSP